MGIGVTYSARTITPNEDGTLPKEEYARLAQHAQETAENILKKAKILYVLDTYDVAADPGGNHDSFGFTIDPKGPMEGCGWLMYRWLRFPTAPAKANYGTAATI